MTLIVASMCLADNPERVIASNIMSNKLLKLCVKHDNGENLRCQLFNLIRLTKLEIPTDSDLFQVIDHLSHNPKYKTIISLFNVGKKDLTFSREMQKCLQKKDSALNKLFKTLMTKEEARNTRYMLGQLAKWGKVDGRDCKFHYSTVFRNLARWFKHLKNEKDFEVPLFYLLRKCYPVSSFEQYMLCRHLGLGEKFLENLLQIRASVLFSHNAHTHKVSIDSSYMAVFIEACILVFITIPNLGFEAPTIEWFMENYVKEADFGNALKVLRDFMLFSLQREELAEEIDKMLSGQDKKCVFTFSAASQVALYAKVQEKLEGSGFDYSR